MKLIYRARDIAEAYIVSGLLNTHDIETHVGGLYLQGGIGDLAASNFANVHVADEDIVLAKSIIVEYEGEQNKPTQTIGIRKATLASRVLTILLMASLAASHGATVLKIKLIQRNLDSIRYCFLSLNL